MKPFDPFSRRISRREALITGLSAAGMLSVTSVLAACGGGSSGGSATTASGGDTAAGGETTAAAPKTGGTLKYGVGDAQAKDSLDPALALTSVGIFEIGRAHV